MTNNQIKQAILTAQIPSTVTVDDIVEETGADRGEVFEQLRRLDKQGIGRLQLGRRGHKSRFTITNAEALVSPADKVLRDVKGRFSRGSEPAPMESESTTYKVPVAKGKIIDLDLPELTVEERDRLVAFIELLPVTDR